jgi:light-regulated signal transduction histidine kinase (bacteriophytochrome)
MTQSAGPIPDKHSDPRVDLTTCDREPIHIPGSIQPHGYLLVLREPDLAVVQASANVGELTGGVGAGGVVGSSLEAVLGAGQGRAIREGVTRRDLTGGSVYLHTLTVAGGRSYHVSAHRNAGGVVVLELEPAESDADLSFQNLYPLVREFIGRLGTVPSVGELTDMAAREIRRITGFERVLVYQFDEAWNGRVIAEDRDASVYGSFMDLWFPASDIPKQARELYRLTRVRQIVDASYRPVALVPAMNPVDGRPLDLSYVSVRSVSPIHCEYLRNMGIAASFSIAIQAEGRLWGIVSCHHRTPRLVPLEVRTACDLLGQAIGLQVQAKETQAEAQHRIGLKMVQGQLLAYMSAGQNFIDGLVRHPREFLGMTGAGGAAVVHQNQVHLVGETPSAGQVRELALWLWETGSREVFATNSLAAEYPGGEAMAARAAGVLAVSISKLHRSYVLWFRPEVVQTVKWGGDPRKPAEPLPGDVRLHPRRSFETWKETVRLRATGWRQSEVETATELRNSVVGIVLRRAEEMAELSAELERSNKELESFSYSVSHDLRAPFRHIVGYGELLRETEGAKLSDDGRRYVGTIIESAEFAGVLVDNLLTFSQMGRNALHPIEIDLGNLVREVIADASPDVKGREVEWRVAGGMPAVTGDLTMLRLTLQNLVDNAIKYTRPRERAVIEVGYRDGGAEHVVWVGDNGVGFDMRYVDKLFGVFQRLHRIEEFEGTGIGLANVRRVVGRHGGRTWAEGAVDGGATFYFTLPKILPAMGAEDANDGA